MSDAPARFDFDGAYGARYDAVIRRVFPAYDQLPLIVLSHLHALLPETARVLVVGAGTGHEMAAFATRRPRWHVTGVEPSSQMAAACRARLAAQGIARRARVHEGYTRDLPAGETFDAATAISVMHFLPDDGGKDAFLRDVADRLPGGAPLVLVDAVGEPGTPEFDSAMAAWMAFIRSMGMSDAEQAHYREQVRNDVRFVPARRVEALLKAAGFATPQPVFRALVFQGWIARRR